MSFTAWLLPKLSRKCNGSSTSSSPTSSCVFNDVTSGNNAVPGEASYGTSSPQYKSGTGYDLATGLGSVNVTSLVGKWSSVTYNPTTTSLTLAPLTNIPHGSAVTANITVTPTSGSSKPTGDVSLLSVPGTTVTPQGLTVFTLSNGSRQVQHACFPEALIQSRHTMRATLTMLQVSQRLCK
jgi:hypothetical protein